MSNRIFVISGATASGKSALALELALQKKSKKITIINGDSLQIYQGLPILSAQPSAQEKALVEHYLYSYLRFDEKCSVATWLQLIKSIIEEIWQQNKIPLIVGGTGMYLSKLEEGINKLPEIDLEIRFEAQKFFDEKGLEVLQEKLVDLGEKKIIDKQRLIRAYEVYLQTGKTLSWWQQQPKERIFDKMQITHANLEISRSQLYDNCNKRFNKMIENGVFEEVKYLRNQLDSNHDFAITKTLGYQEICDYLDGKISKEKMIEISSQKTRNYAKRQLTWFRNQLPNKKVFDNKELAKKYLLELL